MFVPLGKSKINYNQLKLNKMKKDFKVIRIDKENDAKEQVELSYAVNKLNELYNNKAEELLLSGLLLQNSFAYYQIETIN
jgi:uncharacterized pyridoxamine 5'-phosphate oxidase family protein